MKIAKTIHTPFQKGHACPVSCNFLNFFFTEI